MPSINCSLHITRFINLRYSIQQRTAKTISIPGFPQTGPGGTRVENETEVAVPIERVTITVKVFSSIQCDLPVNSGRTSCNLVVEALPVDIRSFPNGSGIQKGIRCEVNAKKKVGKRVIMSMWGLCDNKTAYKHTGGRAIVCTLSMDTGGWSKRPESVSYWELKEQGIVLTISLQMIDDGPTSLDRFNNRIG
jgi:hypothetical protein